MIDKVVIWGGNNKELALDRMDSHASVNAYFIGKEFEKYCKSVIYIVDMDAPELLLDHLDADLILSTFQYGFTSRIIKKNKIDIFKKIRNGYKGKLCSIIDDTYCRKYYEDILFTVLPPQTGYIKSVLRKYCFKLLNLNVEHKLMGWSADPDECYPVAVGEGVFNIFIDHGPYGNKEDNLTSAYLSILCDINKISTKKKINVFIQDNNGITKVNLDKNYNIERYIRTNKVPWPEVISFYRKCHVFCVTHRESAGLAVIEAAMCGAKIYVPRSKHGKTFISTLLLNQGVNNYIFRCNDSNFDDPDAVKAELLSDMNDKDERQKEHDKLAKTNSWSNAVHNILATVNN